MDVSNSESDGRSPEPLPSTAHVFPSHVRTCTDLSASAPVFLPALARQPINDVRDPLPLQPPRGRVLGAPECLLRADAFPRPPQRNRQLRPVKRALQGTRTALLRLKPFTHTQPRSLACLLQAFLSKEMMYSSALWGDEEGGVRGDVTHGPTPNDLEAAQQRKIHHVLKTARVKPGDRLLEFGTGWGGLAIEVRVVILIDCPIFSAYLLTLGLDRRLRRTAARSTRSHSRWSRRSSRRSVCASAAWRAACGCT